VFKGPFWALACSHSMSVNSRHPALRHFRNLADDSYMSLSNNNVEDLKRKTEETMTMHDDYLLSIGMVTNGSKTELMFFSRNKIEVKSSLTIKDKEVVS